MKFFSYICNCVALDTGMCGPVISKDNFGKVVAFHYLCE